MIQENQLLQLLLGAEVVAVTASLLTAVVGTRGQTRVALTADHLLAVVLLGKGGERGLDHTTSHLEEHLHSGLSSDVVGTDGLRVLELLASEHEALVIRVDVLLLLEHHLHVLHRLRGLDLESKSSSRNSLNQKLHSSETNYDLDGRGRKMKPKRRLGSKCHSVVSRLNLPVSSVY